MDLNALGDFNLVAAQGGFGRASRASGRPKATLSRRVRDLEESLGVRLLERSGGRFRLTEDGLALHARTESLLGELEEAGRALAEGSDHPRGTLRISAPMLFSHTEMGWVAAGFRRLWPEVRIEVTAEDRFVDLVAETYDLVIRINPAPDADLVGRPFMHGHMLVVAPPDLPRPALDDPQRPDPVPAVVLMNHPAGALWRVVDGARTGALAPDPVLRLWSLMMVRDAVRAGAGVALLPSTIVAEDLEAGRLVSWGEAPDRQVELWVLHTSRRLVSRKVSAFVSYLCDAFAEAGRGRPAGADRPA